jgi:hypothetical protein
VSGVPE